MNKAASVYLLLIVICVCSAASSMAQPASSVRDEALKLDAGRGDLTAALAELKTTEAALTARYQEVSSRAQQVTAEALANKKQNDELNAEALDFKAAYAKLVASPCTPSNDDPKKCDAYNAEATRLDKWKTRILADNDVQIAKQAELKTRVAALESQQAAIDKDAADFEARKNKVLKQRSAYVMAVRSLCQDERVAGDKALSARIGFCTEIVEMPAANRTLDAILGRPAVQCPKVAAVGNTQPVQAGTPLIFSAAVDGNPKVVPQYNWMVSTGKIASGQGTSQITVDTAGMEGGSSVTATVEVRGFSEECFASPSWTSDVVPAKKRIETQKVDEFYGLTPGDEAARLDKVADILAQDEDIILWITTYPGKTSQPGDTDRDFKRLEAYFLNSHRVKGWQIQPLAGGERKQPAIELWIAHIKSPKPTADPPKP